MGCGASTAKPHPLDYLQQLQAAPALQQLEYLQQLDSRLTAPTGVMVVPAMVPARRGVNAGVNMGWLKDFAKQVPPGMSTLDVVLTIIKPRTKERLCRFVALIAEQSPGSVGRARVFASHTWKAPFLDLVAALGHLLSDDDLVWIDVRPPARPPARPPRARRRPLTRARRLSARRSSPFCSGTRRTACRRRKSRRRPRISTSRRSCRPRTRSCWWARTWRRWRRWALTMRSPSACPRRRASAAPSSACGAWWRWRQRSRRRSRWFSWPARRRMRGRSCASSPMPPC